MLSSYLTQTFPRYINSSIERGNITEFQIYPSNIYNISQLLSKHPYQRFPMLLDLWAVDMPSNIGGRFRVNYTLTSILNAQRLQLVTSLDVTTNIESVQDIFPPANWFEREIWDLFGILFLNHPDLRRILTDYGFFGHPLRKDFPLTGYFDIHYDGVLDRCVSRPLNLQQAFRPFHFPSPWSQYPKNSYMKV